MNILIDLRPLNEKYYTGISWYLFYFIDNLLKEDRENNYYLFFNSYKKSINSNLENKIKEWKKFSNVKILRTYIPNKILNILFKFKLLKLDIYLEKKFSINLDFLFMGNINFIHLSEKIKLYLVVHDLSFWYFPEFFTLKQKLWHFFINIKKLYERADKIITVSNNTKYDLLNFKVDANKIKVIKLAVEKHSDLENLTSQETTLLAKKYFLYLANFDKRKNIKLILSAFEKFIKRYSDVYLYLVAKPNSYIKKILKNYNQKNIVFLDYFPENKKSYLYRNALALLYPSFYEGFALPPAEALLEKCPVILTANSALLENYSGLALFSSEYSSAELFNLMCYTKDNNYKLREKINIQFKTWKEYINEFLEFIKI